MFFGLNQAKEFAAIDEAVFEQLPDELDVLFPACRQLAEGEVVHFEAQTDGAGGIVDTELDKPVLPARRGGWQYRERRRGRSNQTLGERAKAPR